jgi:catechol 2,3-dioxygenase-like lactoylglutathione lyase family enzyme
MKFHHIGIPTQEPKENARYSEASKLHITDPDNNPYRIEWLRFESDSPMPMLLQENPHLAFEVDHVESAVEGKNVLVPPKTLPNGVRIAFIIEDGVPIEFMEVDT